MGIQPLWKTFWKFLKINIFGGARAAQSVRLPTLDFGLGRYPKLLRSNPAYGSVLTGESA